MKCFQCGRKKGRDDSILTVGGTDIIVTLEEYNKIKFKSSTNEFLPLGKQGKSIVTICGKCWLNRIYYAGKCLVGNRCH